VIKVVTSSSAIAGRPHCRMG